MSRPKAGARPLLDGPLVQSVTIRTHSSRVHAARHARAGQAGFTLIELMVVVVLIAILATIAAPAMRVARDDRACFDYARQVQGMIHRARTLSAGTGGAHLVIATQGVKRGHFYMFEAFDSNPGATPPTTGPNPYNSCKLTNDSPPTPAWPTVNGWVPGNANTIRVGFVDGLDLDTVGINDDANILSKFRTGPTTGMSPTPSLAICVTGNGTTYVGSGTSVQDAIDAMAGSTPFTGAGEIVISRNDSSDNPVGLQRHVVFGGAAMPRILSQ